MPRDDRATTTGGAAVSNDDKYEDIVTARDVRSMDQIDQILFRVRHEVVRARKKHAPMHSPHEGYAVLQEEVDELWEEIKADEGREVNAMNEAVQIAAMAVRYVLDLQPNPQT
jgi:CO dehydrogenase/acetyl-CoA synthase beta subunit